jgi:hypothetical protein
MGRSYWFECAKCGYRARVSGRADRGLNFAVQTILCHDCKELFDAVTRMRVPNPPGFSNAFRLGAWRNLGGLFSSRSAGRPPSFQAAVNRLPQPALNQFRWLHYRLQCPTSPSHRVQSWSEPGKCPRCGVFLERHALPYKIWD